MIDLILGVALALLFVRGFRRGLIKEAISLGVLIIGTIAALRLSNPVGDLASRLTGTGPDASRLIGGILVFLLISITASLLAQGLHQRAHQLPGIPTVNRIGGALLAAGGGALVATLLLSALSVLPVPEAAADEIDASRVAEQLTDPDGIAQKTLDAATGDRFMSVVLRMDDLFDETAVGDPGDGSTPFNVPDGARITLDESAALRLSILVNEARVSEGAEPIARSDSLDPIAESVALNLYDLGWLTHSPPNAPVVGQRLDSANIPRVVQLELVGIGASPASVVEVWRDSEASRTALASGELRRYGVAVANGPAGRLTVLVATG